MTHHDIPSDPESYEAALGAPVAKMRKIGRDERGRPTVTIDGKVVWRGTREQLAAYVEALEEEDRPKQLMARADAWAQVAAVTDDPEKHDLYTQRAKELTDEAIALREKRRPAPRDPVVAKAVETFTANDLTSTREAVQQMDRKQQYQFWMAADAIDERRLGQLFEEA